MKNLLKSVGAMMVAVVMAGSALAVDAIAPGKVKSINADKKEFVLSDSLIAKDVTIKFGADLLINRNGIEGKADLKVGDTINVCHDNGKLTWTAHYILVQAGEFKDCVLVHGTIKSADEKEVVFTDRGNDVKLAMGDAKVRLNKAASKISEIKIGEHCVAIVEKIGEKATLKTLMIERK